jgi:3-isopropylmalate/(R)-2-methylmalate dehydratase small subunit
VLPVQVSAEFLAQVFKGIEQVPSTKLTVDLNNQKIKFGDAGASESFEINSYKKDNLLNGYDDIDFLNNIKTDIQKFALNTPL